MSGNDEGPSQPRTPRPNRSKGQGALTPSSKATVAGTHYASVTLKLLPEHLAGQPLLVVERCFACYKDMRDEACVDAVRDCFFIPAFC